MIAMEMGRVPDTIGSQFLITLGGKAGGDGGGVDLLPGIGGGDDDGGGGNRAGYLSLGRVVEDPSNVLSKLNRSYCDDDGRPYADVRVIRALVVRDPYDDPDGMDDLLARRGVTTSSSSVAGGEGGGRWRRRMRMRRRTRGTEAKTTT